MFSLLIAGCSISLFAADVPAFAKELPPIKSGEPIFEFNGKDLTGFYTYLRGSGYSDPKRVVSVRDGMIVVTGEVLGGFATCGNFADYQLVVEWRWGEKTWPPRVKAARDSGILLHCVGPDGAASDCWMESIECQIIEGGCGDFILVGGKGKPSFTTSVRTGSDRQPYFDPTGESRRFDSGRINWWGRDAGWKDELGFRGKNDVEKPAGEWNRMEVICDGGRITNIVNGFVVNSATNASPVQGKLLFQSEGAEIHFRRIEIRPLAK